MSQNLLLEDLIKLSRIMSPTNQLDINLATMQQVEELTLKSPSILTEEELATIRKKLRETSPNEPVFEYIRTIAPAPRSLTLEVNGACPLSCIMCPRHYEEPNALKERNRSVMQLELFQKYVDQTFPLVNYAGIPTFEHSAVVFYIQNEPLLDPLLPQRAAYVGKKGLGGIVSSTLNVNRKNIEFLETENSGITKLICSVNAVTEPIYAAIMKGGSLRKVKENLEYLSTRKAKSLTMLVQIVVQSQNEPELEVFKRYVADLGLDLQVKTLSRYSNMLSEDLLPANQELSRFSKVFDSQLCSWLWRGPVINALGQLSLCCTSAYHPNGFIQAMGNQTIQEVWNSDVMQKLRYNMLDKGLAFKEYCKSCDAVHPFDSAWKGAGVIKLES